jgi:hypothetical protein
LFPYVSPLNLHPYAVGVVLESEVEKLGLRVPAGMDGGVGGDTLRFVWHVEAHDIGGSRRALGGEGIAVRREVLVILP